jgi:hypothetical protein
MSINDNTISNFYKTRIGAYRVVVCKDFPANALPLKDNEHRDGSRGPFERALSSKYARVFRGDISFNGRCRSLYIKQYLDRSLGDKLKNLFRRSRGKRALAAAAMLTKNGLDSPRIIALAEKRVGPFCQNSILVTEDLADAYSTYHWQDEWEDSCPVKLKHSFVRELGKTVGRMHAENIFHGDLRGGNIFSKQTPEGWHFYFLDNERTMKLPLLPMRMRIKNLVQIKMQKPKTFTNTDRVRFFKAYLEENPQLKNDAKTLASEVAERTRRRLKKIFAS